MPQIPLHEIGSDNIFADLGLTNSVEQLEKAELASAIAQLLRQRQLTQKSAASLLNIDQPKVSALVRGRLDGFSVERLIGFLRALDQNVRIVVTPRPSRRPERGRLTNSGSWISKELTGFINNAGIRRTAPLFISRSASITSWSGDKPQ